MSSFDLSRERELLNEMFQSGLLTAEQHNDRLAEVYNDYRESLQRARQDDAPDPEDEYDDEDPDCDDGDCTFRL